MSTLSIVVPAYNEEESIAELTVRVAHAASELLERDEGITDYEFLIVNDGSADRTEEIARGLDGVRVVSHVANLGYGAALKTGFAEAHGDIICFLDADGTYPPESLPQLCLPVAAGKADIVVGTRGQSNNGMPVLRRVGNVLWRYLLTWIAETRVTDAASGMRAFRRALLPQLLPLPDGLDFIAGFSTRSLHEGFRIMEVPIPYAERAGQSKLNVLSDGWRFLRTYLTVALTYNPLKFFGATAIITLALALYLGVGPVMYYIQNRRVEDWEVYRLMTILVLLVVSFQLVNLGLVINRVVALATGRPLERRSLFGRLLFDKGYSRAFAPGGALLCIAAVVLNHETIWQYALLRSIEVHWSYILTGAALFLMGSQMLATAAILTIIRQNEQRRVRLG